MLGLIILGSAALLAFGLYYVYKKTALPAGPAPGEPTGEAGQLPVAGERPLGTTGVEAPGGPGVLPEGAQIAQPAVQPPQYFKPEPVTQIISETVASPSLNNRGDMRFYNANDGKFYHLEPDGSIKTLSAEVFYNVSKVTWAKDANKAVLEYPDNSKIIYNFDLQRQITVPKHWQDFSFSPDSSEVAAKSVGLSPENRWLITSKDDGTGTKLLEPLGENAGRVMVDWSPSRQTVALSRTGAPQGLDRQEVLFIGLNNENFKSTIVEGLDFQPQWSPTGKKLLYSVDSARSDFKPELWVVNAYGDDIGSNRQMLKINTWANKCAFANDDSVFCAVPRDLPQGAGMSPDIANSTYDDLYKIDLKNGLKTNVPLGSDYNFTSISYDQKNNRVYFSDRNRSGIFKVNL